MGQIIVVTGGARSGKSRFAENKVHLIGTTIGYIATAKITDNDMAERIRHHRESRPSEWPTFEQYRDFDQLSSNEIFMACDTLIFDCVTIAITNRMFDEDVDYDTCDYKVIQEIESLVQKELTGLIELIRMTNKNIVIVTNEVGLSLVPAYRLGNIFRDIAGRMNQYLASEADEVYFIVSGLPMKLK